jgi:16S rRNA (adenine1518-N6/adenine1519-N6)-dimethyltransferase
VDSAFARIVPDARLASCIADPAAFDRIVTAAFSMRRKRLANALRAHLTQAQIEAAGVDPGVRPENVTPEGYVRLARLLG